MLKEFREFAFKGSLLDLAIGLISWNRLWQGGGLSDHGRNSTAGGITTGARRLCEPNLSISRTSPM